MGGILTDNYTIFDNLLEGIQIISPDWHYIYVNDAAAKQSNLKREELLDKRVMEVYPGIEKTKLFSKFKKCMNERIPLSFENEFTFPDGHRAWFESKLEPILEGMIILSTDITGRKKTEDALKSERELLNAIIDSIPVMITIYDPHVGNIQVNKAFEEISGWSNEEVQKMNIMDAVYPDSNYRQEVFDFMQSLSGWKDITMTIKDGSKIESSWANVKIPDGRQVGIGLDIRERKKLEYELMQTSEGLEKKVEERTAEIEEAKGKLKESEERFDLAVKAAQEGIWDWNMETDEVWYSHRYKEMLGYLDDEIENHVNTWLRLLHPDDKKRSLQLVDAVLRGERDYEVEFRLRHKEGHYLDVLSRGFPVRRESDGKIVRIVGTHLDLTELKKAEEDLKRSEIEFRTLTENSVDIINRQDRQFRHLFINQVVDDFLGIPPEDFIGKTNHELGMPEELIELWESKVQEVFDTGVIGQMQFEVSTSKGIRFLQSVLIPEYNVNNEIETVLIISRDITELKQAEGRLKETISELERSNQELESFAYITSHDLQEPLRTIASYAQLLKRRYKGQLDSDADEFIDYMVSGSQRMKQQIQGLLEYSRVGTRGGDFWQFNAENALKHALSNLSSSIDDYNAEVTYDSLPDINGDETQIIRVFQNLIGNALKFRRAGVQPKIHISAKEEDNKYIFSVSDNGIGIEEQYTDRIFEVFKRLHAIGEYEGAGIGLAIVKRIVEMHGGGVWVESSFGEGSTFYFSIPVYDVKVN